MTSDSIQLMATGVQIYGKLAPKKGIVKCVELCNSIVNMKLLTAKSEKIPPIEII